jgi:uncharacterized membrane-anchored protein
VSAQKPTASQTVWYVVLTAWTAFAFWAFSLSYSTSFFQYDLASRLPPFIAALAGAIAIPVSARHQLKRVSRNECSPMKGWLLHAATCVAAVLPLALTAAILSRVPGPMHLSGDDAMGVGLNFLMLVLVAIVSGCLLAVMLMRRRRSSANVH